MSEYLPFTQEFVLAIASDYDTPEKICRSHSVTKDEWDKLREYEPFVAAVAATVKALKENGVTANFKAKIAVEDAIPAINDIVHDAEAPHQSRVAAFQSLLRVAGLDQAAAAGGPGGGFTVNIHLDPTTEQPKLVHEPAVGYLSGPLDN
jgi:hypothetical protein